MVEIEIVNEIIVVDYYLFACASSRALKRYKIVGINGIVNQYYALQKHIIYNI